MQVQSLAVTYRIDIIPIQSASACCLSGERFHYQDSTLRPIDMRASGKGTTLLSILPGAFYCGRRAFPVTTISCLAVLKHATIENQKSIASTLNETAIA